MNMQRLSMLSLMLVAAAGWTPSVLDAAANAAAPQSPAAIPLVFDTWVPGPCSPNGQPQGQCPPGDLFRVRLVSVADGLRSPRNVAFTPDGWILIAELAGRVRLVRGGVLLPEPLVPRPRSLVTFGRRCIPGRCVARRLNTARYSPSSRLARGAHRRPRC